MKKPKTVPDQYRQGDVLLERGAVDAAKCTEAKRDERGALVLAWGEATGHRHQFRDPNVCLLLRDGFQFLTLQAEAVLEHVRADMNPTGEHGAIAVPPGTYIRCPQYAYSPSDFSRPVED